MKINNRRYIGCKTKLLDFIEAVVDQYNFSNESTLADIFAGTGVVGYRFAEKGFKTIVNDTLMSNVAVYYAYMGDGSINDGIIDKYLKKYNKLDANKIKSNYFSTTYGDKYFSENDAKIIGYIRDDIEKNKKSISKREYYYLITSLMYACDKIANTVGHYESFLNKAPIDKGIKLEKLEYNKNILPAKIYNCDANQLAKEISADIVYIDPPYNARQYVNFYHVLENLVRWQKPIEFEGNSMKFKRNELKSDYCRGKAPKLFDELIQSLSCKLIIVSYSNTYSAKSTSSVNLISAEEIIASLEKRGKVIIKEKDYKAFNSGKTDMVGHKELLYVCEVNK